MKKFDFTVCGYVVMNQFLRVREMPRAGVTSWVTNSDYDTIHFGGPGMNLVYCLGKLGSRVLPVLSYVNYEKKQQLVKMLEDVGAATYALEDPAVGSSGVAIMIQDDNKNHMTLACRTEEGMKVMPPRVMEDEFFTECKFAILAISLPHNVVSFMEGVKKHNTPLAFSMRADSKVFPREVLEDILNTATIIFTNEAEKVYIEQMFGYKDITCLLKDKNAKVIVTTIGKKGSIIYSKAADGSVQSISVHATESVMPVIDTTGAGDSYMAGFMYGYVNGKPLKTCAQYGSTMASFIIEKTGSLTNAPILTQMLKRNKLRSDVEKGGYEL